MANSYFKQWSEDKANWKKSNFVAGVPVSLEMKC